MRSANSSRAQRFLLALISGLIGVFMTVVLAAPAHATIIGPTNDLKPIPNTTVNPYSAVVEITLGTDDAGKTLGACTGWMYAPNMVATAGHCVYNTTANVAGGWLHISGMRVWPGINGSTRPYPSCGVVASHASTAWVGGDWRFDYGAFKLDCSVGTQQLLNYGRTPTVGYTTRVVGYPHNGTTYPTDTQWYSDAKVGKYEPYLVYYGNDTESRMSGAPVMEWDGYTWNVIAIHSRGYDASYNVGPRITTAVTNDLSNWRYA